MDVTHHRVLWSPDFPPPACAGGDRPTGPRKSTLYRFRGPYHNDGHAISCTSSEVAWPSFRSGFTTSRRRRSAAGSWPSATSTASTAATSHCFSAARELAGRSGSVVAVTFDPHPLVLLAPERYQPPLTTIAERARLLHAGGRRSCGRPANDAGTAVARSPEAFFQTILRRSLGARGMVEGFNFRFGRDRAGSNETLRTLCAAAVIEFREVPAFCVRRPTGVEQPRARRAARRRRRGGVGTTGRPYRVERDRRDRRQSRPDDWFPDRQPGARRDAPPG